MENVLNNVSENSYHTFYSRRWLSDGGPESRWLRGKARLLQKEHFSSHSPSEKPLCAARAHIKNQTDKDSAFQLLERGPGLQCAGEWEDASGPPVEAILAQCLSSVGSNHTARKPQSHAITGTGSNRRWDRLFSGRW